MKKITNISVKEIPSSFKGYREFVVHYVKNGESLNKFYFVEEGKYRTNKQYINEAKRLFREEGKYVPQNHRKFPLGALLGVFALSSVALATLFTYEHLNKGGDTSTQYTVTWDFGDAQPAVTTKYNLGDIPSYTGDVPAPYDDKEDDKEGMKYHHTFIGWEEELLPVTQDVTYHAKYNNESLYCVLNIYISSTDLEQNEGELTFPLDFQEDEEEIENIDVDWGDGSTEDQHSIKHTYVNPGSYNIKIHSECKHLVLANWDPEDFALTKRLWRSVTLPYGWTETPLADDDYSTMFTGAFFLDKLVIPSSIKKINNLGSEEMIQPFYIKEVVFPSTQLEIGENAFSSFYFTNELVIPNNVTTIDQNAFFDCYTPCLKLPKSVKSYSYGSLYLNHYNYNLDFTDYDEAPSLVNGDEEQGLLPSIDFNNSTCPTRIYVKSSAYENFKTNWEEYYGDSLVLLYPVDL